MPQVGLEPTIPVFERAKTVHALDPAATVRGRLETVTLFNYLGCQESSNTNYDVENKLQRFIISVEKINTLCATEQNARQS
jgi:hypothetical protein